MDRVALVLRGRLAPSVLSAAVLISLAVCVSTSTQYGLIVKFLLGRIAYSTSNAAALLTLGFGLALIVAPVSVAGAKFWRRAFGLSLAAGYGLHAAFLGAVATRYGLNDFDFAIFWADGANSFNALTHSHVGKVGLAVLADLAGASASGYDTGTVFRGEVPRVVSCLLALNFLVCIVAGVAWTKAMLATHARRPAMQWLVGLSALCAMKSQLDGGLFSAAAVAALAVLGVFLRFEAARDVERFWRGSGVFYALTVGGIYVLVSAAVLPSMPSLPPLLGSVALFGCLLIDALHGPRRLGAIVLAAYLAMLTWVEFETDLAPLLKPLPDEAQVWSIDPAGSAVEPHAGSRFDGLPLFEVYRRLGDDPLKPKSVLIALPGMEGSGRLDVYLGAPGGLAREGRILAPMQGWQFASVAGAAGSRLHVSMVSNRAGLPPMQALGSGTVVSRNNFQVYLHWLARRLTVAGWQRFYLGLRSSS